MAQLEEHIEQHVLGCGAGLSDGQRALAMLGFYTSAAQGQNVVCVLQLNTVVKTLPKQEIIRHVIHGHTWSYMVIHGHTMEGSCQNSFSSSPQKGGEAAAHGLSVVFSKKRDCHKLLRQFIQLRIAKGAPLAAEDAGCMALVPHNEEQPQAGHHGHQGHLSCEVSFR